MLRKLALGENSVLRNYYICNRLHAHPLHLQALLIAAARTDSSPNFQISVLKAIPFCPAMMQLLQGRACVRLLGMFLASSCSSGSQRPWHCALQRAQCNCVDTAEEPGLRQAAIKMLRGCSAVNARACTDRICMPSRKAEAHHVLRCALAWKCKRAQNGSKCSL